MQATMVGLSIDNKTDWLEYTLKSAYNLLYIVMFS